MVNKTKALSTEIEIPKEQSHKVRDIVIFWSRMIGWLGATCAAPIATFSIKFGLFDSVENQKIYDELGNLIGTKVTLNGWGIVSCLLIFWTITQIINEIVKGLEGYSLGKQVLIGFKSRVLPLIIAIGVCFFLKGAIDQIIFCCSVIGLSQFVALFLNPLPKWTYEKTKQENYNDMLSTVFQTLQTKIKK